MGDYQHAACDKAILEDRCDDACDACQDPKEALGIPDPAAALRAPLHQAPDADERIVAALAEVIHAHPVNYHQRNVGPKPETSANLRYTSCEGCDWLGGWHDEAGWEKHVAEALAPTVARLIEDAVAAERARAERAEAQVERARGLADEFDQAAREIEPLDDGAADAFSVAARNIRAALAETETGHQTRSEAPRSAEEAASRVPGPDGVREAGRRAGTIVDSEGAW